LRAGVGNFGRHHRRFCRRSGFGPSDAGTQPTSPDPVTEGSTQAADQTLPWLQQQSQNQPDTYGDGLQQGAVDDGSDVDDASGH
jgi:hypothetical protein